MISLIPTLIPGYSRARSQRIRDNIPSIFASTTSPPHHLHPLQPQKSGAVAGVVRRVLLVLLVLLGFCSNYLLRLSLSPSKEG